jgi:ubiquinone/menaquinone biosynthesis C-methylase UbiE
MSRQEKAAQAGKARNWNEVTPMSLYSRHVLPLLTHLAMRNKAMAAERARWIPMATGVVLEIGMGSGLNVPFYGTNVAKLYALEPSEQLRLMAIPRATRAAFPVEFLAASAEAIPLPAASVEWLVTTWTLCSIANPVAALREFQRVLRPEGRVMFVEHGRSPDPGVLRWQDWLTPVWRRLAGGCHLNRPIDRMIVEAGFAIEELERGYIRGPRFGAYLYRGFARSCLPRSRGPLTDAATSPRDRGRPVKAERSG